jgi:hypothetical protein
MQIIGNAHYTGTVWGKAEHIQFAGGGSSFRAYLQYHSALAREATRAECKPGTSCSGQNGTVLFSAPLPRGNPSDARICRFLFKMLLLSI